MNQVEQGEFCPQCGSAVSGADYCPDCGHHIDRGDGTQDVIETEPRENNAYVSVMGRRFHRSEYMMILGGLLAIVGSFLPWYSPSALVTYSGIDIGAVGYFPIIVGAVVLSPLVLDDEDWSFRNMLASAGLALMGFVFMYSEGLLTGGREFGLFLAELGFVFVILSPAVKYYYQRKEQPSSSV